MDKKKLAINPKVLFFALTIVLCTSCFKVLFDSDKKNRPKYFKSEYSINTKINNKVSLKNGCYLYKGENESKSIIVLYNDGFFVYPIIWGSNIVHFKNDSIFFNVKDEIDAKYMGDFGHYFIKEDTIYMTLVTYRSDFGRSSEIMKEKYVIMDENHIQLVKNQCCSCIKTNTRADKRFQNDLSGFTLYQKADYYFYPLHQKPDSSKVWIKQRKWFWKNEEEFKQFMKENNF